MLEQLKTFITVVEQQNFTKAAELINISQPSVSVHIKQVEDYFDAVLIQRSIKQKQIHITEEGRLVYERAKQIIQLLRDTHDEVLNSKNIIKGNLRIGASFTIEEYVLPNFLGQFTQMYPDLQIEILTGNTHNICEKLRNFQVDVALIEGTATHPGLSVHPIYQDNLVIILPYDHPLSKQSFSSNALIDQTWISRESGSGTKEFLELFLSTNNLTPKHIIQFGTTYSVKDAVKNNLGIALISSLATKAAVKNKEISILEPVPKYTRTFYYSLLSESTPSKASLLFIEMLKDYMINITF